MTIKIDARQLKLDPEEKDTTPPKKEKSLFSKVVDKIFDFMWGET